MNILNSSKHRIRHKECQQQYERLLQHCLSCIADSELIKMGEEYRIALPYRFLQFADFQDGGIQAGEETLKK